MGNNYETSSMMGTIIKAVIVIFILTWALKLVIVNGADTFYEALDEMEIEHVQEFPDGSTVYLKTDSIKGTVGKFFLGIYTIDYVDAVGVLHTTTVSASSIHPTRKVGGPIVPVESEDAIIDDFSDETDSIVEPYDVW